MEPKNVIIYSDLDGTLFSYNSNGTFICERNVAAIKKWMDEGGGFSIASGRNLRSILPCFAGLEFNLPMVLSNGALIYSHDEDKVKHTESLSRDFINEAIEYYKTHDYFAMVLSDIRDVYIIRDEIERSCPKFNYTQLEIEEIMTRDFLKISFVVEPDNHDQVVADLSAFKSFDQVIVSASSKRYIEVANTTKAIGIKKVVELNHLENKTIVCIGDYLNDLEMLKLADIPACPENAHEEVKSISKIKTVHHNDGAIADLIEKILAL